MINWQQIDIVLLDMDGTLLDLNFDNHFWQEHVPLRYAEKHGIDIPEAKDALFPMYRKAEGTMDWYSVDYWTNSLQMDIAQLKAEIKHLIDIHPYVIPFLDRLKEIGKQSILVTNAHQKSLMLKMDETQLHNHLDHIICAHDFGMPKEDQAFWDKLKAVHHFDNKRTLFCDDSLPVLRSARQYGIENLLAIYKPDSQRPEKDTEEFEGITYFREIMP